MLGTLLEQAEAENRVAPSVIERLHLVLDGSRHRLGALGLYGLLPPAGVLFAVLWSIAEAGPAFPELVGVVAAAFGLAIALARLAPPSH